VAVPDWIWFVFVFAFGCCIGSFLNVVIYRLPRDKSLIRPPSSCPSCNREIAFYDNIPLFSWLLLGRKCRHCKAPISARYFVVELLTGSVFLGLFITYFHTAIRPGMPPFGSGGWLVYLLHILLLAAFIGASGIDMEHWVIPLSICWLVTGAGFVGSAVGGVVIDPALIRANSLLPSVSLGTGAMGLGAAAGLGISWILLATGLLKRSYLSEEADKSPEQGGQGSDKKGDTGSTQPQVSSEPDYNHRLESFKEILFLLPIVACSVAAYLIVRLVVPAAVQRDFAVQHPVISGLLGSVWGYFVGCGTVWSVRIFGTMLFGREAMGLGDMHLMGAAGAVTGPLAVVVAFLIAPFFGLAYAGVQMFFKKIRQIPYGPFLSLGIFAVMILYDRILDYVKLVFSR
jgi:leader peptidase (prepilin peptidase)/N-methyltransferase